MAVADPVAAEADGFRHPSSEAELIALVPAAAQAGRQLRVRGAAHSISHAVYTDPVGEEPNQVGQQTPPAGDGVNIMLDRYRGWRVRNEARRLVEADAGIHLGADPSDPTGTATLETSLLHQLFHQKRWTLSNLGGITHQTLSGFTATGSSGGSVTYSSTPAWSGGHSAAPSACWCGAQYPRWDEFLALRAQRDPRGMFLTRYWRDRFGLWGA